MPAYDTFHEAVKRGLIKDGWTISDDPYTITYGGTALYVDMPTKPPIAADRGDHLIAVEVEHFNVVSLLSDYHTALGRYVCHRLAMRTDDPRRVLFLALPRSAYEDLFAVWFTRQSLREYRIPLIA
jgi:XisH protein